MSEKSKNGALVKSSAVKAFEEKVSPVLVTGVQQELIFDIEIEKEVNGLQMGVLTNGTPYLTQTGLAQICGIGRATLYDIEQEFNELNTTKKRITRIKELLVNQWYSEKSLFIYYK